MDKYLFPDKLIFKVFVIIFLTQTQKRKWEISKQWPLAPNSPNWRITRANVSRRVTFFSKVANVERERMYRVRGKWLANVGWMYRVRGNWLANVRRMYRVRGKWLANVRRMYRVRPKLLANVGASKIGCFMHN